jgi:hypothetical protein
MAASKTDIQPAIYLLRDHLNAALILGEELLREQLMLATPSHATSAETKRAQAELGQFVASCQTLELALTARLLEGRKRAQSLRRESHLKPLIALFVSGTTVLADAVAELGDRSGADFQTGRTALAYLRTRGMIAVDQAGLEGVQTLTVTENYLVVGRIRLGTLLDLVATFLDTLDLSYNLYRSQGELGDKLESSPVSAATRRGLLESATLLGRLT